MPPLSPRGNIFKGRRRHAKRKKAGHDEQYARAKGEKMSRYAEQDMHAPPCALFTYVQYMPRQSCMTNVVASLYEMYEQSFFLAVSRKDRVLDRIGILPSLAGTGGGGEA
jgi:hypothetical protein